MNTLTFFIRRCIYSSLYMFDRAFGSEEFPVVIFCYHSIAADDWRFGIDKTSFIQQVDHLLSTRLAITVDDLTRHISGEKLIDKPSFIICFDDGYKDILSVREYLASHNIKPLLFVLSSPEEANIDELGTRREFLTKEDIQDLHKEGWAIGSHSATHSDFWHLSNQQLYTEIILSRKDLEKDLGFAIKYFAYPRGRYNQEVLKMVERSGYQLAFSMDDGRIDQSTKTFAIPRIGVDRTHVFSEFQRLASPAKFSGYFSTNSRENYFDEDTDVQGYTFIETLSRLKGEDYLKTVSVYQDASTKRFIVKRLQYKRKNIPYAQLKNEANIIYLFSKKATEDLFPGVRFCQFVDFYEKKGDVYLIREFVSGETLDNLPEENKLEYLSKSLEFLSNAKSSLSQREIEKISYRSNWLILISCPVYFLGAVLKEVRLLRDFTQLFLIFIVNFPYKSLISPFYVLTHRDLHLKNIIFNGEEIVIIDPEICVFAERGLELAMAGVSYKKNQGSLFLKLLFEKNIASVEMKNTFRAFSSYYIFQELLLSRRKTQSYLDIKKYLIDFNDTVHLLPTTLLK